MTLGEHLFKKIMGATIGAVVIAATGLVGGLPAAQAAPALYFPFPAGVSHTVTNYSHPNDGLSNNAVDIGMSYGDAISASAGGKVIIAGLDNNPRPDVNGNEVMIDHGGNYCTQYGHLSSVAVKVGQYVSPGTYLGGAGDTGLAYGIHLHWNLVQCSNRAAVFGPVATVENPSASYWTGKVLTSQNGAKSPGADGERVSDFSGDGQSDVLGVDGNGDFWFYPHNGNGLSARTKIGSGWANHKHVMSADWSGDGAADVLGVDPAGDLWYYPNNNYQLSSPRKIGSGWGNFLHVAAADWSGDGQADVIGVDANGDLWYYAHSGTGLSAPVKIGSGWANFKQMAAADWSGDGHADVIGVDANGDLWYYGHNGNGLSAGVKIGSGWANHKQMIASDWSGDDQADILGVDANGDLWYYAHNGNGLSAGVKIGSGWSTFRHIM
ncbi:peptidase M23 [Arthrobacter sp. Leaf137]|nr:peptidase M23 [Arthrobacter sp. Leaf137]